MIKEKYRKDVEALVNNAHRQGDKMNLSMLLITINCEQDELIDILEYLGEQGIEVINEDVEPDSLEDKSEIDMKVTPFDPSKIDIKMDRIPIASIVKRIEYGELEFDSSFQRKAGLWKIWQKSQLIESIFLKIPLPAFYFDASDDDKWQIIDGLQRIGTIKEFVVDKSFALMGLEFLTDLEGLKFDELPRSLQRRIEETNLNAYLVNPTTPKNVKFNIFKRINTGGLVLELQEIRNALYQGQATEFLLEMSNEQTFVEATDYSIKKDRMLDREFCLRYIAFTQLDLNTYNGSLDEFLNSGMEFLGKRTEAELAIIKQGFIDTMEKCKTLFGRFAFRRVNIEGRRGPVNKAIFEIWSRVILNLNACEFEALLAKKYEVRDEFTKLCNDYTFQNMIRAADKYSVRSRISRVEKMVQSIINEESSND